MATVKELRQEAGWTVFTLAAQADVSIPTISRMERGDAVSLLVANKVLRALSKELGRKITAEDAGVSIIAKRQPEASVA